MGRFYNDGLSWGGHCDGVDEWHFLVWLNALVFSFLEVFASTKCGTSNRGEQVNESFRFDIAIFNRQFYSYDI